MCKKLVNLTWIFCTPEGLSAMCSCTKWSFSVCYSLVSSGVWARVYCKTGFFCMCFIFTYICILPQVLMPWKWHEIGIYIHVQCTSFYKLTQQRNMCLSYTDTVLIKLWASIAAKYSMKHQYKVLKSVLMTKSSISKKTTGLQTFQ